MAPIKSISCPVSCGCYQGLICDTEIPALSKVKEEDALKMDSPETRLARRNSTLAKTTNVLEFAYSSLELAKFARDVDEEDLARKAHRQARLLFPTAMDTLPARQSPFKRTYGDTVQEHKRRRSVVRMCRDF